MWIEEIDEREGSGLSRAFMMVNCSHPLSAVSRLLLRLYRRVRQGNWSEMGENGGYTYFIAD
jgi:hypothetical protein